MSRKNKDVANDVFETTAQIQEWTEQLTAEETKVLDLPPGDHAAEKAAHAKDLKAIRAALLESQRLLKATMEALLESQKEHKMAIEALLESQNGHKAAEEALLESQKDHKATLEALRESQKELVVTQEALFESQEKAASRIFQNITETFPVTSASALKHVLLAAACDDVDAVKAQTLPDIVIALHSAVCGEETSELERRRTAESTMAS